MSMKIEQLHGEHIGTSTHTWMEPLEGEALAAKGFDLATLTTQHASMARAIRRIDSLLKVRRVDLFDSTTMLAREISTGEVEKSGLVHAFVSGGTVTLARAVTGWSADGPPMGVCVGRRAATEGDLKAAEVSRQREMFGQAAIDAAATKILKSEDRAAAVGDPDPDFRVPKLAVVLGGAMDGTATLAALLNCSQLSQAEAREIVQTAAECGPTLIGHLSPLQIVLLQAHVSESNGGLSIDVYLPEGVPAGAVVLREQALARVNAKIKPDPEPEPVPEVAPEVVKARRHKAKKVDDSGKGGSDPDDPMLS